MEIYSPLSGETHPLAALPDPVFSSEMLGPGIALWHRSPTTVDVCAPVPGTVDVLFPHAFTIGTVLVHLGIDTAHDPVFRALVHKGDEVAIGTPIIRWDLAQHRSQGKPPWVAVILVDAGASIHLLVENGSWIPAGAPLFAT